MEVKNRDTGADLAETLRSLRDQGIANYDANRLHLISSLVDRAATQSPAVARLVLDKARVRLQAYQQAFLHARVHAARLLEAVQSNFPEYGDTARELYESGAFQGLERLAKGLERSTRNRSLRQLRELLDDGGADGVEHRDGDSATDILRQQELELIPSHPVKAPHQLTPPAQLRSAQHCRDALAQLEAEQRVARASRSAPEDSGPLNPHKLATRSLLLMRDLSPAYLGRFIAYLDTLAWLEDNTPKQATAPGQNGLKT